jgi:lipopolysaccharide export LptBFGC system permease protein LptF
LSVLLSLGHCVVCSSVSWPLCCLFFCLLAIVLSFLLRFTYSYYPFGIFKLFDSLIGSLCLVGKLP